MCEEGEMELKRGTSSSSGSVLIESERQLHSVIPLDLNSTAASWGESCCPEVLRCRLLNDTGNFITRRGGNRFCAFAKNQVRWE